MNQILKRRLAAILATDMVGFSMRMGVDEVGTLSALRMLRRELIDPSIERHGGRVFKTTGDGLLAVFASVVDAVNCAIDLQLSMAEHNNDKPPDKRVVFRMGVNLGEVISEGNDLIADNVDIFGDGVNIAARIEPLARHGGICLSNIVYLECRNRIEAAFHDGGEQELKNIANPVRVWHWSAPNSLEGSADAPGDAHKAGSQSAVKADSATKSGLAPAGPAGVIVARHGKPSIVVQPLDNLSSDPQLKHFADAMKQEIVTGLSGDSRLHVISSNSSLDKELGARYRLEGGIRPGKKQYRINVQLVETASGINSWTEKIDLPADEMFDRLDELVHGLVTALCSNIAMAECNNAQRQKPENLPAWALCVQAEVLYFSQADSKTLLEAEKLTRRATEIEPDYAAGWALLACVASSRSMLGLGGDLEKNTDEALLLVKQALMLAPKDPVVLGYCGYACTWAGQATQAVEYLERSLEINPNNSFSRLAYGAALWADAAPEEGLHQLDVFLLRSPKDPYIGLAHLFRAFGYLALRDLQQAEESTRQCIRELPNMAWGHLTLAMLLTLLQRDDEARAFLRQALRVEPGLPRECAEDFFCRINPEVLAGMAIALTHEVWC